MIQSNLVIRNKLVLRNHFPWPNANLLHKDREHLALRNNFSSLLPSSTVQWCGDFGCGKLDQWQIFVLFQISYTKYPKVSTTLLILSFEKNLWNYPISFFYANFQIEDDQCQCQYCDRFFPDLDSVQSHILEKHCEYCKFCNMMIQGNFEDHLYNSHYKQKRESVIPQQTRGCAGKKWYFVTKIVLVINENFWNSRLKAKNMQNFWYLYIYLFKQLNVSPIFCNRFF